MTTISDVGRSNLGKMGQGLSYPFHSNGMSIFQKRPYFVAADYVIEQILIPANQTTHSRGGNLTKIDCDRRAELTLNWRLKYDRAAYTNGSSVDTYPVQWEGDANIDNIRVTYNNKEIHSILGDQMVRKNYDLPKDLRIQAAKDERGDLSELERLASGAAAQTTANRRALYANPWCPWNKNKKAIEMLSLGKSVIVEIKWKTLAEVTRCASGTVGGGDITNVYLECDFIHLTENERIAKYNNCFSKTGVVFKDVARQYVWRESHTISNTSGYQSFNVKLQNITDSTFLLRSVVEWTENIDNSVYRNITNWLPHKVYLSDGSKQVTNEYSYEGDSSVVNGSIARGKWKDSIQMYPDVVPGENLGKIPFCSPKLVRESEDNCFGSRTIGSYKNATAVVTTHSGDCAYQGGPNSTSTIYITIEADIHQLYIFIQGDFRKYINA